jgi:5'-methylthioadenosine phosphorylase
MVTDYDSWRSGDSNHVEIQHVLEVMHANAELAKTSLKGLCAILARSPRTPSPIDTVLDTALVTAPAHRDASLLAKLDAVAGRVLTKSMN